MGTTELAYAYRTPGVRFEWLDPGPEGVLPLRTDITGFVGIAERGPLHRPVRVESWTQFTSVFGGRLPQAYLAWAVSGYFDNGGRTCWVVRVADPDRARPGWLRLLDEAGRPTLRLLASSPGTWSRRLEVTVARTARDRFSLILRLPDGQQEAWKDLSMLPEDPRSRYVERVLNHSQTGSRLVVAHDLGSSTPSPHNTPLQPEENSRWLRWGEDGLASLACSHFTGEDVPAGKVPAGTGWGLATLEKVDEIAIVAMPDAMPKPPTSVAVPPEPEPGCEILDGGSEPPRPPDAGPVEWPPPLDPAPLQQALVAHCERLRYRVAVLDVPDGQRSTELALGWLENFPDSLRKSGRAALYHPWVRTADLLTGRGLRAIPPSGHVAGVYARGDALTGVHRPPANEIVEAAADVRVQVDDIQHGQLNDGGVNVIRSYAGRGLRIGGARTISGDPLWRYVNVRRLLCMIEASVDSQTQWAVFEQSTPELWRDVDRTIRVFLDQLWRLGALDGATAEDAYSVQCDEATNPPQDVEAGRLACLVGVLPPWPAEFVVVRIGRTPSGSEILEQQRAGDA